jgi:tight adherence protein C
MITALPIAIAIIGAISVFLIAMSMVPTTNVLRAKIEKLEQVDGKLRSQPIVLVDQVVSREYKSTVQSWLNAAGWYESHPEILMLSEFSAYIIGISFGVLLIVVYHYYTLGAIVGVLLAMIAWRIPAMHLHYVIKVRKESIGRALPDFLDLLSATVRAGLSLNAAIIQAAEATKGPLHEELTLALSETRLGRSREEALKAMADRVHEDSLTMTVSAIVQAEKLGSDLADVLQELAKESRDRRWMRAEEKAAQLPIKMIIPMALFMIPSLYLMIFGPVIAQFVESHQ